MSKPRRTKGTLYQKDGENSIPEIKLDQNHAAVTTNGKVDSNQPSTPTQGNQEIVVMYPLEKNSENEVNPENCPENLQSTTTPNASNDSPGLKAMLQQLMANQKNDTRVLQNEISGVSTNMAKKMENTEKKMADMITLSSNNL